jgi:UDP-glucose 4-epimerase
VSSPHDPADTARTFGRGPVLVTGGSGFIGLHLVAALVADGRPVRVLDDLSTGDPRALPAGVELVRADVADAAAVRAAVDGVAAVFHLAAVASVERSNESWRLSHVTNSLGGVTVMEAVRDVAPAAALVYASSAAVYGVSGDETNGTPGDAATDHTVGRAASPITPYGIDKRSTEMHALVGGRLFGLRSLGLRLFNVYGPGQAPESPYSGVISRFVAQAEGGGPFTIHGDGRQTRDFVEVGDVVRAMLMAEPAATAEGAVVDICTGRPTSILELAELIGRLVGTDGRVIHLPSRLGDIRRSTGDPSAAAGLLGWRARIELEAGLRRLTATAV